MRKIVVFMHTSIDGMAAGPNGEMNWIHVDDEIFNYAGQETDKADTALYGKNTFQMMDSYWPTAGDAPDASRHDIQHSTWYNSVDKVVLSRTTKPNGADRVTFIGENVADKIKMLKEKDGRNILVFGSISVVRLLLAENLVDELWLFVNPVVLGSGLSFFTGVKEALGLKLAASKSFASGVVCLHYTR